MKTLLSSKLIYQNILDIKEENNNYINNFFKNFTSNNLNTVEPLSFLSGKKEAYILFEFETKIEESEDFFDLVLNVTGISNPLESPLYFSIFDRNENFLFSSNVTFPSGAFHIKKIKKAFKVKGECIKNKFYIKFNFYKGDIVEWNIFKIYFDIIERKKEETAKKNFFQQKHNKDNKEIIYPIEKTIVIKNNNNYNLNESRFYFYESPVFIYKFPENHPKNFSCDIFILSNTEKNEPLECLVGFFNEKQLLYFEWEDFSIKNILLSDLQTFYLKVNEENKLLFKKTNATNNMIFFKLTTKPNNNIRFFSIKNLHSIC